jgi:hypothetical protein
MDIIFEIESVARGGDLQALLAARGWRFGEGVTTRFIASHPDVKDQSTARARLDQLGILTSRRLRIEFGPGN